MIQPRQRSALLLAGSIVLCAYGLMWGLPNPFEATRYHSLAVERSSLPAELEITAQTDDGEIMGLKHRSHPVYGVQFHPESILTGQGKNLLQNFLDIVARGMNS